MRKIIFLFIVAALCCGCEEKKDMYEDILPCDDSSRDIGEKSQLIFQGSNDLITWENGFQEETFFIRLWYVEDNLYSPALINPRQTDNPELWRIMEEYDEPSFER